MNLIAISLGMAALTSRQGATVDPNQPAIQAAFTQLGTNATVFLQLMGSTTYRGRTIPMVTSLSYNSSISGTYLTVQAEMESWVNGTLVKRVVADGNTVWAYDLSTLQYSATSYAGRGTVRPTTYITDLLNDLNLIATGPDAYLTRLLRQTFNTSNQTYESWMPGFASSNLPLSGPTTDPVNPNLQYSPTVTDSFYMYDNSPKRTIVFEINQPAVIAGTTASTGATLETVYFNQYERIGGLPKTTIWQIKPYPGVTFSTTLFQPYNGQQTRGWRPIPIPRPVSN